jgi:predicted nuclease with TOPRIM domain
MENQLQDQPKKKRVAKEGKVMGRPRLQISDEERANLGKKYYKKHMEKRQKEFQQVKDENESLKSQLEDMKKQLKSMKEYADKLNF